MPEDIEKNKKSGKSEIVKNILHKNPRLVIVLVIGVVLALGGWGIYSLGINEGKKKDQQQTTSSGNKSENPLVALPASGTITKVENNEITVELAGKGTQSAIVDTSTNITRLGKTVKADELKSGAKVVLFTKKSDKSTLATRIIIQ